VVVIILLCVVTVTQCYVAQHYVSGYCVVHVPSIGYSYIQLCVMAVAYYIVITAIQLNVSILFRVVLYCPCVVTYFLTQWSCIFFEKLTNPCM
jgi:hypothetical protein